MRHIINPKIEEILHELHQDEVFFVTPEMSVHEAGRKLTAAKVTGMPVIENNRIVGVITEQVFLRKVLMERLDQDETKVADVMVSKDAVVKILPRNTARTALEIMETHHIRHLPVIDDAGVVKGFLSQRSLVEALDRLEESYLAAQQSALDRTT